MAGGRMQASLKVAALIEKIEPKPNAKLSTKRVVPQLPINGVRAFDPLGILNLIARRITLAAIFFLLKTTIQSLD
jgi:hypothetical protein